MRPMSHKRVPILIAALTLAACGATSPEPTEPEAAEDPYEPETFVQAEAASGAAMALYAIAPSPHLPTREAGLALDGEAREQFDAGQYDEASATFVRAAAAFCEDSAPTEDAPCNDSHHLSCKNAGVATYNASGTPGIARLRAELEPTDPQCAAAVDEVTGGD